MRRLLLVATLVALLVPASAPPARADQAPFWPSPVGLIPGHPTTRVRMASETVDIDVVERGDEILAVVAATFNMVNDGDDETMTVGFPTMTTSLFDHLVEPSADGRRFAEAPIWLPPHTMRAFRVVMDGRELRSWRQEVPGAAESGFGTDWLMWEMTYPAGRPARVDVQYEQAIGGGRTGVAQPSYVLRTGALWAGPIGLATVTMTARDGGAFVGGAELYLRTHNGVVETYPGADQLAGPSAAVEHDEHRIVWRVTDAEPTRDVGATYIRSTELRALTEPERAVVANPSSPDALRRSASVALEILGGSFACSARGELICFSGRHRAPFALVDRLAVQARERARRATELAPDSAEAQVTFGDLEAWSAMPDGKHHGELGCWPTRGALAYQRAVALGSDAAGPRLAGLRRSLLARAQISWDTDYFGAVSTCPGDPPADLDLEMVRATIEEGNRLWSAAVEEYYPAEQYPTVFAGRWLDDRRGEVAALKASAQRREARLMSLEHVGATFGDGGSSATAETVEVWRDRTLRADGTIVRDTSGRLRQRYELRKIEQLWKIVGAEIVRE